MKTLIGAQPDDHRIRRSRLAWVAEVIRRRLVKISNGGV